MKRMLSAYNLTPSDIFAALAASFCTASLLFALFGDFTDLHYVYQSSTVPSVLITVFGFAALVIISCLKKTKKIIAVALLASSLILALVLAAQYAGMIYFNIGVSLVLLLVAAYIAKDDKAGLCKIKVSSRASCALTAVFFVIYVISVFFFTALKYKSYSHGTFDFGIFAQMFEQMAKTGLPVTTVERSRVLSHFAVHFSPVYYIILPGYYLFRSPLYLLFSQAFVTGFGVFPLRRICKALKLSEKITLSFSVIYLIFPTMANGAFYDFHENKFLTVFILYLIYFVIKEKPSGIIVFSLLTLSVKEDAFIYVLAVAIWMFFTGRKRRLALILACIGIAYFAFAVSIIYLSGGEIMESRFANYSVSGSGGMLDAVKTCFLDIGYLIKEVFSGADIEAYTEMTYSGQKLEFVMWCATPLLFLPFAHKEKTNLLLLIPMLVINLMPSWMYQYNIDYQYTYGTVALLIFSAVLCFSRIDIKKHGFVILSMLLITTVFFVSTTLPKAEKYANKYFSHIEEYELTDEALETIPEDASVTAYGYIMPHIAYIDDLHSCPDYYADYEKTDYYIIDKRYECDEHTEKLKEAMGDGYTLVCDSGFVKIYKSEN